MIPEVESLVQQLTHAQERLHRALEGISEVELRKIPAEEEWSVAEIIGHIVEFQPFWMGKVPLMTSEDNPYAGRTAEEEDQRLEVVAMAKEAPLPELQRLLQEANEKTLGLVRKLQLSQLSRRGRWSEGRTYTVREMIEQIVIEHLLGHAKQIQETRDRFKVG